MVVLATKLTALGNNPGLATDTLLLYKSLYLAKFKFMYLARVGPTTADCQQETPLKIIAIGVYWMLEFLY